MNENIGIFFRKNFLKIIFVLAIIALFFYILLPFIKYIVLGGILAMAVSPIVDYFIVKKEWSRQKSLLILGSFSFMTALLPLSLFVIRGSRIASDIISKTNFSALIQKMTAFIDNYVVKLSSLYNLDQNFIETKIAELTNSLATYLSQSFGNILTELPNILLVAFITLLSLYFFLSQEEKCKFLFQRYFYFSDKNSSLFISTLKSCCREIFITNIATGLIQATIVSVGALFFQVGDFFLIFFITFVVSFIPIVGAAPVAVILGLFSLLDSNITAGIAMLTIALVAGVSDNIIRPYLSSKGNVETNPIIGLIAIIGGVTMFGLPGLFIGPLVVSVFFGVLPIILDEYFPQD